MAAFDYADRRRELVPGAGPRRGGLALHPGRVGLLSVRSPELALRLVPSTYGEVPEED